LLSKETFLERFRKYDNFHGNQLAGWACIPVHWRLLGKVSGGWCTLGRVDAIDRVTVGNFGTGGGAAGAGGVALIIYRDSACQGKICKIFWCH
jgi:hypothetical protein